jgi:methylated-DNA-[protein]-cysteine S-methyltransferase
MIGLAGDGEYLTGLLFGIPGNEFVRRGDTSPGMSEVPAVIREAHHELVAYLSGTLTRFSVPLAPDGTAFQVSVWNALRSIPYGETRSYLDIARLIGKPSSCRAVGMANNRNPVPIFIPCHRVIGADGSLTGYAGGLDLKRKLLALERGLH